MPLIFLVEPENRYVERVRDALEREGWQLEVFDDKDRALQRAASSAPDLVIVNLEVENADTALKTFARKTGGPGALALIAERRAGEAGALGVHADAYLIKPFTDSDLRQTVKRLALTTHGAPPQPSEPEAKLTSHDLFGDLLAEFSDADDTSAAGSAAAQAKADAEIQRKLEETLSGVLGSAPRRPPTVPPVAPPAAQPLAPPAASAVRRPRTQGSGVEDLLSKTLSELDLGKPRAAPKAAPAPSVAPPAPKPSEILPSLGTLELPRMAEPPGGLSGDRVDAGASTLEMPRLEIPAATLEMKLPKLEEVAPPAPAPAVPQAPVAPAISAATQRIPVFSGELAAGQLFGQYSLIEKIAIGGMAEVWKARMRGVEGFEKTVAIKRILPHLTDNSAFLSMFIDEAKLAAQLNHPNITHIYDLGKIGEVYYIAMEFVEGRNLRALLSAARRRGLQVPVGLSLLIAARLASALDYAHRKKDFDGRDLGLVHRDVSPQNVLLSYEGDIKLCDFGIVKAVSKASHTQMGALKGKLQYMSPEQAWGRAVDGRSDLFSLGSLLFEMLTGRRLFPGDNEITVLDAVREGRVESARDVEPSVPVEVDEVVRKALARDPAQRYASASEMQSALETVLYNLRPAPTQADLAAFLRQLFLDPAPVIEPGATASETTPSPLRRLTDLAAASSSTARTAPPAAIASPSQPPSTSPSAVLPATPHVTVEHPKSAPGVQVIAPPKGESVDLGEVGGGEKGRGFKLLVAALLLVALAVAVWNMVRSRGDDDGAATPKGQEQAAPSGEVSEPSVGEPPADAESNAAAGDSTARSETASARSATPPTLDQQVETADAKKAEETRRKLEEQRRELERQLAAKNAEQQKVAAQQQAEEEARQREADLAAQQQRERERADEEARLRAESEAKQREQEEAVRRAAEEKAQRDAAVEAARTQPGALVALGPGVTPPRLVSRSEPEYPPVARRLRAEGEVEVSVLVDENGTVTEAKVTRSTREGVGFEAEAVRVARAAKFSPATKDGVRVKVWYKFRIPFRLKE